MTERDTRAYAVSTPFLTVYVVGFDYAQSVLSAICDYDGSDEEDGTITQVLMDVRYHPDAYWDEEELID